MRIMRTKYTLFTLMVMCVSASYTPLQAGQEVFIAQPPLALPIKFPIKTAESSPANILDQAVKSLITPTLIHHKTGIRQVPGDESSSKRKLVNAQDDSSELTDLGLENQEGIFYRDRVFEGLQNRLNIALANISTWLKKNKDIVLILGLDIDETIIHPIHTNLFSSAHSYTLEQQAEILHNLDQFASKNKNIYLFYSTARPGLTYGPPPAESSASLACCFSKPAGTREINAKTIVYAGEDILFTTYKLPASKAIITGGGCHIEFESESLSNDPAVAEINTALKKWFDNDTSNQENTLTQISSNEDFHASIHTSETGRVESLPVIIMPKQQTAPLLTGPYATLPMLQFITLKKADTIKTYAFNGVAINKGTASRLLLSILRKKNVLKGKKGLLVTAGDSLFDLPLINPILEAASIERVSPFQEETFENRLKEDITKTEIPKLPPNSNYLLEDSLTWLKGVLMRDEDSSYSEPPNEHMLKALSDQRVVTIQGKKLGLTVQLFEQIDRALKDYQAKRER